MSAAEIERYREILTGTRRLLEFGAGYSTRFALDTGVQAVDAVDSDRAWLEALAAEPSVRDKIAKGHVHLHWANIGPTGEWGYPTDTSQVPRWPTYWWGCWRTIKDRPVDTVLVDGRFRVACAAVAAAMRPQATIIIHDFGREWYRPVLDVLDNLSTCETLWIGKPRVGLDFGTVLNIVAQFGLDPR